MSRTAVTRRQRLHVARSAAELASAIRQGDAAAVDRSQQELVLMERSPAPTWRSR